jgi:hypothetical protein
MSHASMRIKFARRPRCNELARVLPANRCYAGTVERGANPMRPSILAVATLVVLMCASARAHTSSYCEVQKGDFPHDVAAGVSGEVWYSGQNAGDEQPNRTYLPRQECSTIRRNRGAGRRALVHRGIRARAASGRIRRAGSGSANGIQGTSAYLIHRRSLEGMEAPGRRAAHVRSLGGLRRQGMAFGVGG